jgi:hypothetical protein
MCQHFSGHMFKQLFAALHTLRATNIHWMNASAPGYKTLRYIQTLPAWPHTDSEMSDDGSTQFLRYEKNFPIRHYTQGAGSPNNCLYDSYSAEYHIALIRPGGIPMHIGYLCHYAKASLLLVCASIWPLVPRVGINNASFTSLVRTCALWVYALP